MYTSLPLELTSIHRVPVRVDVKAATPISFCSTVVGE